MLPGDAGQRVAEHSLHEADELNVLIEDPAEERSHMDKAPRGRDGGTLGEVVLAGVRPDLAGAEVNCPARCIQQPGANPTARSAACRRSERARFTTAPMVW